MITTQTIDLSMTPEITVLPEVYCSQYDNGIRQVVFNLFEDAEQTTPYNVDGLTAIVQGTKPDNNAYAVEAQASGSSVTVTITTQMAAVAGIVPSEIVLIARDTVQRIGSLNFLLMVEPAGILDDAVVSDSEIPIYVDLAVKEAAAQAEAWANGHRGGVPVGPDDPAYHNNAEYWSRQSAAQTIDGLRDVDLPTPIPDGTLLCYDETTEKWGAMDEPLSIEKGGTGNASGYVRVGLGPSPAYGAGEGATAEGISTRSSSKATHAEGLMTEAYAEAAHAEGNRTTASGNASHAEGYRTEALGQYAHAEGYQTTVNRYRPDDILLSSGHAEGAFTCVANSYAHVGGHGRGQDQKLTAKRNAEFLHGNTYKNKVEGMGLPIADLGGVVFGVDCETQAFTQNTEIDLLGGGGLSGIINGAATVTAKLEPMAIYLLFCSSFTIATGAIVGSTARLVAAIPTETGVPNILSLAQTQTAPATITAVANNTLTIANVAGRAAQFNMIRVM